MTRSSVQSWPCLRWQSASRAPAGWEGADGRRGAGHDGTLIAWLLLVTILPVSAATAASLPPVESITGLVVSAQRLAAEAGVEIIRKGGTAIDAAVAVGYAEAVVNPCCGNIGGGGFLTAYLPNGRAVFIDFRETAPAAATPSMYLDASGSVINGTSLVGWRAIGVPGTVLGLDTALTSYGTLPRATVMAPAIRLARDGFVLTGSDADILARGARVLHRDPAAAAIFLHPDGSPLHAGETLRQSALAVTLQAIADHGPDAFYRGHIPEMVEAGARQGGGVITAADFAAYRVHQSEPLRCTYRGYTILSAPPPSSGGTTLCEALNILEGYDLRALGFHGAQSIHVLTETLRLAYLDRNTALGDPAFVHNPLDRLLSKEYAARLRELITDAATPSSTLRQGDAGPEEKTETTHFSVLDANGSAVSVTFTLNGGFGAGVMAGDAGFLLNDEMDDFTIKSGVPNLFGLIQGDANTIAPGKRPLSSMAPTIVLRDGEVQAVLGSPGGARIISVVLETLLNVIDYGMNAQEAVDAPRLHHQFQPDMLYVEPFALSPDTLSALLRMNYHIELQAPWGAVALIANGRLSDSRPAGMPTDSVAAHGARHAAYYGAIDPRRAAGAALAP